MNHMTLQSEPDLIQDAIDIINLVNRSGVSFLITTV